MYSWSPVRICRELEASLAARAGRVAELEADRAEIEGIRMLEMDMVMELREEVDRTRLHLTEVREIIFLGLALIGRAVRFF